MAISRKKYIWAFTAREQIAYLAVGFLSLAAAERVCETESCNHLSAEIRDNMNTAVDPCENFFQYACGGWIAAHPLPEGFKKFSRLNAMQQELQAQLRELLEEPIKPSDNAGEKVAKQQFQSCMSEIAKDQDNIKQVLNIVESVSLWPMISTSSTLTKTWQQIHDEYNKMTGQGALYAITIYKDNPSSTVNSIFLDQPEDVFNGRLQKSTAGEIKKYQDFLTEMVIQLVAVAGSSVPEETIRKDVKNLFDFRVKLAKLTSQSSYRALGPSMSIPEAQQLLNKAAAGVQQLDIFAAIQTAFSDVKDVTVSVDEKIHVREEKYHKGLQKLLANTSIFVILNHIHLYFVERHLLYTTTEDKHLLTEMYGPDGDRVTYCINLANIQVALSSMYIKRYFSAEQRAAATEIAENIQNAIRNGVRRSKWLEAEAFIFTMNKINELHLDIGYTDAIVNDTEVEDYYAEYNMDGNHLENILNFEEVEYRRLLGTLRHRTTEDLKKRYQEWPVSTMSVYRAMYNRFELPAGILRWPYFDINLPNNANYATTGTIVGHTLGSMVDKIGYHIDQTGRYVASISPISDAVHTNALECFERQYTDYIRNFLKGTAIIYDDRNSYFAQTTYDSFGLSEALEAYENKVADEGDEFQILPNLDEFDHMQQFFLAFASSYCEAVNSSELYSIIKNGRQTIGELRVNFAVSNMMEFSDTFNCTWESPMNPVDKCAILKPPPYKENSKFYERFEFF